MKWKSIGEGAYSSWKAKVGNMEVSIHRHIDYDKDRWLLSTRPPFVNKHLLENKDMEAAKKEAIALLLAATGKLHKAFKAAA